MIAHQDRQKIFYFVSEFKEKECDYVSFMIDMKFFYYSWVHCICALFSLWSISYTCLVLVSVDVEEAEQRWWCKHLALQWTARWHGKDNIGEKWVKLNCKHFKCSDYKKYHKCEFPCLHWMKIVKIMYMFLIHQLLNAIGCQLLRD